MPIEPAKPKRQRADRRKTIEKVAAAVLKNPRGSVRQIAKAAGVSIASVSRVESSGELKQTVTKDNRILTITNLDAQLAELGVRELVERLKDEVAIRERNKKIIAENPNLPAHLLREKLIPKELTATEINSAVDSSTRRHIILRGTLPKDPEGSEGLTPEAAAKLTAALAALGRA